LTITDAAGEVVRTLKGLHKAAAVTMTPEVEGADAKTASGKKSKSASAKKEVPWVSGQAGLHRIYWDLRADGPVRWTSAPEFLRGPKSGAMLPPGTYTVTLKIGGHSESQKLTVVNDPASQAPLAGMQERYATEEAVLHELSQVDVALNRLHAIDIQLDALQVALKGDPQEAAVANAIQTLRKQTSAVRLKLTSNAGAEESVLRVPDEIHEKLSGLVGNLEGEDTAPTAVLLDQKRRQDAEYRTALQAFNAYLSADVAAFNHTMASHKLGGLVAGEPLQP
jgi:hypothetical protein